MSFQAFVRFLPSLALVACKAHGVPEPPPDRDPTRADAAAAPYDPPADLLSGEVHRAAPADEAADEPDHHHHHGGHGGQAPAAAPKAGGS